MLLTPLKDTALRGHLSPFLKKAQLKPRPHNKAPAAPLRLPRPPRPIHKCLPSSITAFPFNIALLPTAWGSALLRAPQNLPFSPQKATREKWSEKVSSEGAPEGDEQRQSSWDMVGIQTFFHLVASH